MKVRPILFSAPMVLALLAGRKTQTRRVMKGAENAQFYLGPIMRPQTNSNGPKLLRAWMQPGKGQFASEEILCPYGQPGDLLYVRETVRGEELDNGSDGVRYVADDAFRGIENTASAADAWLKLHTYRGHSGSLVGPPVPGIHQPRWASRLTLAVTDVRVERLQNISEADAIAEGVFPVRGGLWSRSPDGQVCYDTARMAYCDLWCEINGKDSWNSNPWVWAVTGEVHQQNVDAYLAAA